MGKDICIGTGSVIPFLILVVFFGERKTVGDAVNNSYPHLRDTHIRYRAIGLVRASVIG